MHPSFNGVAGIPTENGYLCSSLQDIFAHAQALLTPPPEGPANDASLDAHVSNTRALNRLQLKRDAGWENVILNPCQDLLVQLHQQELTYKR